MRIVVAYKWAANPQDAVVAPDGAVDWSRAAAAVSEYDLVAIELGRRLADATGGELVGVTVGGPDAASTMAKKAALSRGPDRLVVSADDTFVGAGPTRTALALAELVARIGDVDLVLAGDSSVDSGAQMVPAILAGALRWPALLDVTSVQAEGATLHVERNHAGGSQRVDIAGPAVLCVTADAVTPRVPGMKDILAAGRRPTEVVPASDVESRVAADADVIARSLPQVRTRKSVVIDAADPDAAAAQLLAALRADSVI